MKLNSSNSLRKMGGSHYIYRTDPKTNVRSMMVFNETATFLWKKFVTMSSFTSDDMADALVEEYEIDLSTATNDVEALLAKWRDAGLVE